LKQICFLVSLPRSGNTVIGSILNQNKNIVCTANSIVFELLHRINQTKNTDMFMNFPDYESIHNVSKKIINNYYQDWKQKIIIDRSPATTPKNFEYYDYQNYKFIFLKRDLIEIVKSFINLSMQNKDQRPIKEIYEDIMNPNNILLNSVLAVSNGMKILNKKNYILLDYENFINDPKKEINKIYTFLNLKSFNHKFKNFNQFSVNGLKYDDNIFNYFKNLHKINTKSITKNSYNIELPSFIIDFCRNFETELII